MSQRNAVIDDLCALSGFSEVEASELRLELKREQAWHIGTAAATWRYFEALRPVFERLAALGLMSRTEIDRMASAQIADRAALATRIAAYRQRWGAHPQDALGHLIELPPAGRKVGA